MTVKRIICEPTFSSVVEDRLLYYYLTKEDNDALVIVGDENKANVVDFIKKKMPEKKIFFDNQEIILTEKNIKNRSIDMVSAYLKLKLAQKFHVNSRSLSATFILLEKLSSITKKSLFDSLVSLRTTDSLELKKKLAVLQFDDSKQDRYLHSFVQSSIQNFNFFQQIIEFLYIVHKDKEQIKTYFPLQPQKANNILIMTLSSETIPMYKQVLLHLILNMKMPCYLSKEASYYLLRSYRESIKAMITMEITSNKISDGLYTSNQVQEVDVSLVSYDVDSLISFATNNCSSASVPQLSKEMLMKWIDTLSFRRMKQKYFSITRNSLNLIEVNNSTLKKIREEDLIKAIEELNQASNAQMVKEANSKRTKVKHVLQSPQISDTRLDQFGFPTDSDDWY